MMGMELAKGDLILIYKAPFGKEQPIQFLYLCCGGLVEIASNVQPTQPQETGGSSTTNETGTLKNITDVTLLKDVKYSEADDAFVVSESYHMMADGTKGFFDHYKNLDMHGNYGVRFSIKAPENKTPKKMDTPVELLDENYNTIGTIMYYDDGSKLVNEGGNSKFYNKYGEQTETPTYLEGVLRVTTGSKSDDRPDIASQDDLLALDIWDNATHFNDGSKEITYMDGREKEYFDKEGNKLSGEPKAATPEPTQEMKDSQVLKIKFEEELTPLILQNQLTAYEFKDVYDKEYESLIIVVGNDGNSLNDSIYMIANPTNLAEIESLFNGIE